MTKQKPLKIKLRPLLDQETADAITAATLEAIDAQLYKAPVLTSEDIGKDIKGEGIYLGVYEPVDRDGILLKKIFNVFAAPEDLPQIMTYNDTVKYMADLKAWHGHGGTNYAADKELYAAIKDGTYTGGWIIPTCDVLYGQDAGGKKRTPDSLLTHKGKGLLKGTFKTKAVTEPAGDRSNEYWSSTEGVSPKPSLDHVYTAYFLDNKHLLEFKDSARLSCRPVRLVERAP